MQPSARASVTGTFSTAPQPSARLPDDRESVAGRVPECWTPHRLAGLEHLSQPSVTRDVLDASGRITLRIAGMQPANLRMLHAQNRQWPEADKFAERGLDGRVELTCLEIASHVIGDFRKELK